MTIHCTDCQGELDPAYFDTRCKECDHTPEVHFYLFCTMTPVGFACECCEWQQKVLRCETCEARARNQDSYDDLTPWQQWNR